MGVVFYWLMTRGNFPCWSQANQPREMFGFFDAMRDNALIPLNISREDPRYPLVEIVHKMVAKDPDQRFETARADLDAFRQVEHCVIIKICKRR